MLSKKSKAIASNKRNTKQHVEQEEWNNNFEQKEHIIALKPNTTKQIN
jgi:hypothetical protein